MGRLSDWLADKLYKFEDWLAGPPEEEAPAGPITRIPPGEAKIEVEFVAAAPVGTPFKDLMEKLERMQKDMNPVVTAQVSISDMQAKSHADEFIHKSKLKHRLPDLTNATLAKSLHVTDFGYSLSNQGHYRLVFVEFEDGSTWESGKTYA